MEEKKQKVAKDMFRKMRFSMSDPIHREELWNVHISPAAMLGSAVAFFVVIFLLVLVLGYCTSRQQG